jgi:hypothetical protein
MRLVNNLISGAGGNFNTFRYKEIKKMVEKLMRLIGYQSDLEYLEARFTKDFLRVIKRDYRFYLSSNLFEGLSTDRSILEKGIDLLKQANGIAKLQNPSYQPVKTREVTTFGENGTESSTIFGESPLINTSSFPDEIPVQEALAERWLKLASKYEHVKTVLEIIDNGYNWEGFSKIIDTVEGDLGGKDGVKNILSKNWVNKDELKRLIGTSNNFKTLGQKARHGRFNQKAHPNPLTFEEASNLIKNLLTKWLESKN